MSNATTNNGENIMTNVETLISTTCVETGKTKKSMIVAGDCRESINKEPSFSFNGKTIYRTAQLVNSRHRNAKWYSMTRKLGLRDEETGAYDVVTPENEHLF